MVKTMYKDTVCIEMCFSYWKLQSNSAFGVTMCADWIYCLARFDEIKTMVTHCQPWKMKLFAFCHSFQVVDLKRLGLDDQTSVYNMYF